MAIGTLLLTLFRVATGVLTLTSNGAEMRHRDCVSGIYWSYRRRLSVPNSDCVVHL